MDQDGGSDWENLEEENSGAGKVLHPEPSFNFMGVNSSLHFIELTLFCALYCISVILNQKDFLKSSTMLS